MEYWNTLAISKKHDVNDSQYFSNQLKKVHVIRFPEQCNVSGNYKMLSWYT